MSSVTPNAPASLARFGGYHIVVTRPRNSADALVRRLQRHDAAVLRLPGQTIHANPDFDWAAALQHRPAAEHWIFNSPSAVLHAKPLLDAGLDGQAVYAVGAGTARALRRCGVEAIAPDQQQDSEGLLGLPDLSDVGGQRIILISAPGGRGLIAAGLRQRGAIVEEWPVYRREPAQWTQRQLQAIERASSPLITLLSSAESLEHLHSNLPASLWLKLRDAHWVVSSPRLASQLHSLDAAEVAVAASAGAADLIAAIVLGTKR